MPKKKTPPPCTFRLPAHLIAALERSELSASRDGLCGGSAAHVVDGSPHLVYVDDFRGEGGRYGVLVEGDGYLADPNVESAPGQPARVLDAFRRPSCGWAVSPSVEARLRAHGWSARPCEGMKGHGEHRVKVGPSAAPESTISLALAHDGRWTGSQPWPSAAPTWLRGALTATSDSPFDGTQLVCAFRLSPIVEARLELHGWSSGFCEAGGRHGGPHSVTLGPSVGENRQMLTLQFDNAGNLIPSSAPWPRPWPLVPLWLPQALKPPRVSMSAPAPGEPVDLCGFVLPDWIADRLVGWSSTPCDLLDDHRGMHCVDFVPDGSKRPRWRVLMDSDGALDGPLPEETPLELRVAFGEVTAPTSAVPAPAVPVLPLHADGSVVHDDTGTVVAVASSPEWAGFLADGVVMRPLVDEFDQSPTLPMVTGFGIDQGCTPLRAGAELRFRPAIGFLVDDVRRDGPEKVATMLAASVYAQVLAALQEVLEAADDGSPPPSPERSLCDNDDACLGPRGGRR